MNAAIHTRLMGIMPPLLTLAVLTMLVADIRAAHGQSPLVFSIQPAQGSVGTAARGSYFTYTLGPGSGTDDQVVVTNSGSEPAELTLYASDGITSINGSTAFAANGETRSNVRSWLTAGLSGMSVPAGQSLAVPFHVQVPVDAAPGDHVAGWVVEAPPRSAVGGVGASVVERAGVAVVVRVPGPAEERLTLGTICLNQETGSNYFETPVSNEGNVLTKADGALTLETKDGQEVFNRPAEIGNVVPNDSTLLRLDAPFDPGRGEYVATISMRQPDGREVQATSEIKIGSDKVNGCTAAVAGAQDEPSAGIPYFGTPPGGSTPWLILFALIALLASLLALREYMIRRSLKQSNTER